MPFQEFKISGYLEPEEVHAILNVIPKVSNYAEKDILLVELLWQSGGRVSEITTLLPERIGLTSVVIRNLKQKKIKMIDGKPVKDIKGKPIKVPDEDALKEVEISADLCQRLKDYCSKHNIQPGEWVFKGIRNPRNPINRLYVWRLLTLASEQARVFKFGKRNPATGGRFKGAYPHLLRHSNAMYLLDQTDNIDLVREHLGHSSVVTTQAYARVKKTKMKKTIKNIEW